MPWQEVSVMSQRSEFVDLAGRGGANIRELCRRFSISPKTAYKWLARARDEPGSGLEDRSRRPHHSPRATSLEVQAWVAALREEFAPWGPRKLRALMDDQGYLPQGVTAAPNANTLNTILRRQGLTGAGAQGGAHAWQRFEHEGPNHLWQMDFKGHFPLVDKAASRCHPLTVLDDHSRTLVCLRACPNEREEAVKAALTDTFRIYGLPLRMTADNGSPWADPSSGGLTRLGVWLSLLGVRLSHSRPYHPQTQGKDERLHRTLDLELLLRYGFDSMASAQLAFDRWRHQYNHVRPHEACSMRPPISRYQVSPRPFPETLPSPSYPAGDFVRRVSTDGKVSYKDRAYRVGKHLVGQYVALRPTDDEAVFDVFFLVNFVRKINLTDFQSV